MRSRAFKHFERKRFKRAKATYARVGAKKPLSTPYEIIKGVWVTHGRPVIKFGHTGDDFIRDLVTVIIDTPVYFNHTRQVYSVLNKISKEFLNCSPSADGGTF